MRIAVITGASSGLGAEFARQLDESKKEQFDEFLLIARRKDKLNELAQTLKHKSTIIAVDITDKNNILKIKEWLEENKPTISVLVCAAGMGIQGNTEELSREDNNAMIDLNCRAAVDITTMSIPYLERGSRIIEICSTAGFQPIPGLNVYAATKAFLIYYTKTLHYEMLGKGVCVTAVCPYWVKDTEFIEKSEIKKKGFKNYAFASKSKNVVKRALRASRANLWISTPNPIAAADRVFAWVIPDIFKVPFMDLFRRL